MKILDDIRERLIILSRTVCNENAQRVAVQQADLIIGGWTTLDKLLNLAARAASYWETY